MRKVRTNHNQCSTCQLPARARAEVDALLQQRPRSKTLAEIAVLSGISKSSLSRHFKKCLVGKRLKQVGAERALVRAAKRLVIIWPSGQINASALNVDFREADRLRKAGEYRHDISRREIRDDDLLVEVIYDDLPAPQPATPEVEAFLESMRPDDPPADPEPKPAAPHV